MPNFTCYNPTTGEGLFAQIAGSVDEVRQNAPAGSVILTGYYGPEEFYFPAGVPTHKGTMTPTISGATLSGLPDPCTIIVDHGAEQQVTGGSFTVPGNPSSRHSVTVKNVRFRTINLMVIVP